MTHKNYTKTPLGRRLFFWALVVTFFCTTATIIFFSLGYRFSFVSDVFIHAGSINVKSTPRSVDVIIDGQKPSGRHLNFINDSYHITGIRPGPHDVIFTAPDYKPWHNTVTVHSGRATEFWNMILVKNFYDRTSYGIRDLRAIYFAPKYDLVAIINDTPDHTLNLTVKNIKEQTTISLLKTTLASFDQTRGENIEWAPDTSLLSVPIVHVPQPAQKDTIPKSPAPLPSKSTPDIAPQAPTTRDDSPTKDIPNATPLLHDDYIIAQRTKDLTMTVMYLSSLLPQKFFTQVDDSLIPANDTDKTPSRATAPPSDTIHTDTIQDDKDNVHEPSIHAVRFHPREKNTLYALIDDGLYLITIPSSPHNQNTTQKTARVQKLMDDVAAYDLTDDGIFVLTRQGVLFYDRDYTIAHPQPLSGFDGLATGNDNRLIAYDRNRVLFLNVASGTLSIFNKKGDEIFSKVIGQGIVHARFSDDGKKVVYHDGHHVKLFMTRDWPTQPVRTQNTIYAIATIEPTIMTTEWSKDYEHIIIATNDHAIALLSLDHRFSKGHEQPVTITTRQDDYHVMIADHGKNKIFFTDRLDETTELFSIDFPQKETGLFQ